MFTLWYNDTSIWSPVCFNVPQHITLAAAVSTVVLPPTGHTTQS